MIASVRLAMDIFAQPNLSKVRHAPLSVPASDAEADVVAFIEQQMGTNYHPTCTCAIGRVVDSDLRVFRHRRAACSRCVRDALDRARQYQRRCDRNRGKGDGHSAREWTRRGAASNPGSHGIGGSLLDQGHTRISLLIGTLQPFKGLAGFSPAQFERLRP